MKMMEYNEKLLDSFSSGIAKLTDAVEVTLGPRGRNVVIWAKNQKPFATKDGVTVSKFVELSNDQFENLAVHLVKEAADKTNSQVGDGTTTATVLSKALFQQARKFLTTENKPSILIAEMEQTVSLVQDALKNLSIPINDIQQIKNVATISANGHKDIGDLVGEAIDKIGIDGSIVIKDSTNYETLLEIVEGFKFDSGYLLKEFVNESSTNSVAYDDAFVLVTNKKIVGIDEIKGLMELVAVDGRPLIIIADEIDKKVSSLILHNFVLGALKIAIVNAPYFGNERTETLEDIALITGAKFFDRRFPTEIKDAQLCDLGLVKKINIKKYETILVDGNGSAEKIAKRLQELEQEFKEEKDSRTSEKIMNRINRLSSAMGIIHVGGHTQLEQTERKHRVEDALEAANAAMRGGLVPGGGCALVRASDRVRAELGGAVTPGATAVLRAILAPFDTILQNADINSNLIRKELATCETNMVYDVNSEKFVDYLNSGIIDPLFVTQAALQNSFSIVSILLNTGCSIIEV